MSQVETRSTTTHHVEHEDDVYGHSHSHGHGTSHHRDSDHLRRRLPIDSVGAADPGFIQNLPHQGGKLTQTSLSEYYQSCGIDRSNIWWVIPVSCFAQLLWIFVAYKIYKRCVRSLRTKNNDAQPTSFEKSQSAAELCLSDT